MEIEEIGFLGRNFVKVEFEEISFLRKNSAKMGIKELDCSANRHTCIKS